MKEALPELHYQAINGAYTRMWTACLVILLFAGAMVQYGYSNDDSSALEDKHLTDQTMFLNQHLMGAYFAFQAWKSCITSDPNGITQSWVGYKVCDYKGVFCAPALDDPTSIVVAGVDLNHGNVSGTLPEKLGHLAHLALFHINTNRFSGSLPLSIIAWKYLYELDISNNRFSGLFPSVVLHLPNLAYLDIRFNGFEGTLPPELFTKRLDAVFLNDNHFEGIIPETLGDSPASAIVFARNKLTGCIPPSIGKMVSTLNEVIFLANSLAFCLPPELGALTNLTVLDVSFNKLSGFIPQSFGGMTGLEQLDVAHNLLSGTIADAICELPNLENFTASFNFFTGVGAGCFERSSCGSILFNDSQNCIEGHPRQRGQQRCSAFLATDELCSIPNVSPPALPPPPQSSLLMAPPVLVPEPDLRYPSFPPPPL